jgi:hypothetical protein
MKKERVKLRIDLQCGSCGALYHLSGDAPRFCPCCGAAYDRYCIRCQKRVEMFFEEWWPEDDECIRTYTPAKRCPKCNAGLEVEKGDKPDQGYEH